MHLERPSLQSQLTPEIIDRVRQGNWNPDNDEADRKSRDALAARGYWQAFQAVKDAVGQVIAGENPGARAAHKLLSRFPAGVYFNQAGVL